MQKTLITILLPLLAVAQALPLQKTDNAIVFGDKDLQIAISPQNGSIQKLEHNGVMVAVAQPNALWMNIKGEDGAWLPEDSTWKLQDAVQTADDTLRLDVVNGNWSVHVFTQLFPEKGQLRRWFEIAWIGDKPSKIRHFQHRWFRIPMGEGMFYNLPANRTTSEKVVFDDLKDHAVHRARIGSRTCIFQLAEKSSFLFLTNELAVGFDNTNTTLENCDDAVDTSIFADIQGHMQPNVYQTLGEYWLWLQNNDSETALTRIHEWHRDRGLVPPADRPDWVRRATLYSFHPKGSIGSLWSDWGGFEPSIKQLDRIAELGCNAIWLLPLEDLSPYWPRDYYKFQDGLGTPEQYKQLVDRAHELGLHVIQDIVPHGGSNTYQRAKDHPEWLLQQEDGSTLHYWCFDFNWPSWIDYMKDVARHYVKTYGIDGYRIDACGSSKTPNWNQDIPYSRASQSLTPGGINMQKAIRDGSREFNREAATLAETGANVFGAISDCLYDFTFCYDMMQGLRKRDPQTFAKDLRRWLHEQQCTDLPGQIRLRHIESHDSIRAEYWYGPDGMRRAMAISAWIPGIPMVYQDMEDGHGYFFQKVFKIRNSLVEMGDGDADYLSVDTSDDVFAVLRTANQSDNPPEQYAWDKGAGPRVSIVAIKLGNEWPSILRLPVSKLPEPFRKQTKVFELMTGQYATVKYQEDNIILPLTQDGIAVFRFGGEPEKLKIPEPSFFQEFIPKNTTPFTVVQEQIANPIIASLFETPNSSPVKAPVAKQEPSLDIQNKPQNNTDWQPLTALVTQNDIEDSANDKEPLKMSLLSFDAFTFGDDGERIPIEFDEHFNFNIPRNQQFNSRNKPVPNGLLIRINIPNGTPCDWRVDAANGVWEDCFRTRHPQCDGVVRNIYYMTQGGNVLWNSLFWPFGIDENQAMISFSTVDASLCLKFETNSLPLAVFLLDRVGDDHAPHLFIAEKLDDVPEFGTCPFLFTISPLNSDTFSKTWSSYNYKLKFLSGQYFFSNSFFDIYFGRNGVIRQIESKPFTNAESNKITPVIAETRLYTDAGFGEDGVRYSANDAAEPFTRITRIWHDKIRLQFLGTMRGFNRFETMSSPIDYYLEYTFNNSDFMQIEKEEIDFICGIRNRQPAFGKRSFTAWMLTTNYPKTHIQMVSNGRCLQEGNSDKQRTMETKDIINPFDITEIRFKEEKEKEKEKVIEPSTNPFATSHSFSSSLFEKRVLPPGPYLMKYINWQSPMPPANVFLHNKQFFIAWHDGPPPENDAYGQWRFFSMLICPRNQSSPNSIVSEIPPFAKQTSAKLSALQNPDFEENSAKQWFRKIVQFFPENMSWNLPKGAALDATTVHSGKIALKIDGFDGEYRLVRQNIPLAFLPVGSMWKLSCWVKSDNIQPGTIDWMNGTLRLELFREGKPVEYRSIAFPREAFDWQQFSVELTVPEDLTKLSAAAGLNGNRGLIWLDDFSLERIDNPNNNKEK